MKNKKFKYALNSTVIVVGAVIAAILLNMILVTFDSKIPLKISLVRDEIYRLTDETNEIIDKIDKNTTITVLHGETGNSQYDGQYTEILKLQENILKKYADRNDKITFEKIDFVSDITHLVTAYPKAVSEIQNPYCAMIFTQGERYEIAEADTYITTDNKSDIERVVTNKLASFVDGFKLSNVLLTQGHGEASSNGFASVLNHYNYNLSQIDLLKEDLPDDTNSLLIVNSPKADFAEQEIEKLDKYLEKGGIVQIYFDPLSSNDELSRLESYLKDEWSIIRNHNIVVDMDNVLTADDKNYGLVSFANLSEHEIAAPIKKSNRSVMYSTSNAIEISSDKEMSIEILPILQSTKNAYLKELSAVSESKKADDKTNVYNLAVTASREDYTLTGEKTEGKLLVSGSGYTFNTLIGDTRFANEDMLINSINWMRESEAGVTVRAKELPQGAIAVPNGHYWVWFTLLVIVIPVLSLVTGFVIWRKRRFK